MITALKRKSKLSWGLGALIIYICLACGSVETEKAPVDTPQEVLQIEIVDPMESGVEGSNDTISVKVTVGEATDMNLYYSTNSGASYVSLVMNKNENDFSLTPQLDGYKTLWYLTAQNNIIGAQISKGSARFPFSVTKRLNKENADEILRARLNELRSSNFILRYDNYIDEIAKLSGNTQYPFVYTDIFDRNYSLFVDHYALMPTSELRHKEYIFEYSEDVKGESSTEPEGFTLMKERVPDIDVAYVKIYGKDYDDFIEVLRGETILTKNSEEPEFIEY